MNRTAKIAIVVALAVAVCVVIAVKQSGKSGPAPGGGEGGPGGNLAQSEGLPVLVDLGAETCIPCKIMAPMLEELKKEYAGRLVVRFLDIDKNPDLIAQYNISIKPTQIFYDASGKELFRHEGFYSKDDILAKFKALGVDLSKAQ